MDSEITNGSQKGGGIIGCQISIKFATGLMHVSASKQSFCLLISMFQGPIKSMWTSYQGRTGGAVQGVRAPVG